MTEEEIIIVAAKECESCGIDPQMPWHGSTFINVAATAVRNVVASMEACGFKIERRVQ